MASRSTYAFEDINLVFQHPAKGIYEVPGKGLGSISFDYAGDNTSHDVAADGSIMVSKIRRRNGTISIEVQQTSLFHSWLKDYANAMEILPANQFASASILISSPTGTGDQINFSGVSLTKRPGIPYQAEGQRITWTFMATDISMSGGYVNGLFGAL